MKTLNFKNISSNISREEMHLVRGGRSLEGGGGNSGNSGNIENSGTCGYRQPNPGGFESVICGISKSQAISFASSEGGYWCCDSCGSNGGSASYC